MAKSKLEKSRKVKNLPDPGHDPREEGGLVFIADIHIHNHARWGGSMVDGINARGLEVLSTLRRALEYADKIRASAVFIAGDLFHSRRPEPALISAVQHLFEEFKGKGGRIVIIPGNHDMLDASAFGGNTAVAPLYQVAEIVRAPMLVVGEKMPANVFCVPFDSRESMRQYLLDAIEGLAPKKAKDKPRILMTHIGVYDKGNNPPAWQLRARDAIPTYELFPMLIMGDFVGAYVGNYHDRQTWTNKGTGPFIQQIGTLCPSSFSDAGFEGRGYLDVWNKELRSNHQIPGPRFYRGAITHLGARAGVYCRNTGEAISAEEAAKFAGYEHVPELMSRRFESRSDGVTTSVATPEEAIRAYLSAHVDDESLITKASSLISDLWRQA